MLVFVEEGKSEYPEKNPRSKDENQKQTQPLSRPLQYLEQASIKQCREEKSTVRLCLGWSYGLNGITVEL